MITIDKVSKEVAKRLNLDPEIVAVVCKHSFQSVVEIMKDETEDKDILFNKAFKFKLKRRYKENKNQQYCSK